MGVCAFNLGEYASSEQYYVRATQVDGDQLLAWQGLANLHEKTGEWPKLVTVLETTVELLRKDHSVDAAKVWERMRKLLELYEHSDKAKLMEVCTTLLSTEPLGQLLSILPDYPPDLEWWRKIAQVTFEQEDRLMKREIESRRRRIDAPSLQFTVEQVERQVFVPSKLSDYYRHVLELSVDPHDRLDIQGKLLRRVHAEMPYFDAVERSVV
jgi:superkiller protein 3